MTTTREDREAAARLLAAEPVSATVHRDMAYWIANAVWPGPCLVGKSVRGEHAAFAEALSKHRVASTQALREAAERLLDHLDVEGADQWVSGWEAEACRLRDALRSALSPSPAQGGAAVPATTAPVESGPVAFGVGDVVRVAGLLHADLVLGDCEVERIGYGDQALVRDIYGGKAWVHPRDLVLVRKAIKP